MLSSAFWLCRGSCRRHLLSGLSSFSPPPPLAALWSSAVSRAAGKRPAVVLDGQMKLDTAEFRAIFTPEVRQLADLFRQNGYELRIAGGAVRDLLMRKLPEDIDFATTATPAEMKAMFEREGVRMLNTKGETHGTVTARINDRQNFEVTTLRVDRETDGRHAEVEFTRDWKIDAERRDLTINSMFLGLDGTLVDFFHGKEDLEQCRVAFVGDATARIREDYLRILRYFRFYGRTAIEANAHCPQTLQAIRENGEGLAGISGERIWTELRKISVGNHAASMMECMHDLQLTQYMGLPLDADIANFRRVWQRAKSLEPRPVTLLASLLRTEADVQQFEARLRISADERKTAQFLVNHRGDKEEGLKAYKDLVFLLQAKEKNVLAYTQEVLKYRGDGELLARLNHWPVPKLPVTGKDLLAAGVPKGKGIGTVLDRLKEEWMADDYTPSREDLLARLPQLLKDAGDG